MTRRVLLTATVGLVCLVGIGAIGGATLRDSFSLAALLRGAGVGLVVGLVLVIHFVARTIAGRTAEASGPEFAADSVERKAFQGALASLAPDAVSIMGLVALGALLLDDTTAVRLVAGAGFVFIVVDLALRVLLQWRSNVGADA